MTVDYEKAIAPFLTLGDRNHNEVQRILSSGFCPAGDL